MLGVLRRKGADGGQRSRGGVEEHTQIQVHDGKTQVWNRSGKELTGIQEPVRTRIVDPDAVVWRGGGGLDPSFRGINLLGGLEATSPVHANCVVSISLCLSPPTPADLTASSTAVATIEQRARRRGSWEQRASH